MESFLVNYAFGADITYASGQHATDQMANKLHMLSVKLCIPILEVGFYRDCQS